MRYNYREHFDLLTIRHEYLKNTDHVEEAYIKRFQYIANITASMMFDKLHPNFDKVGFDKNDIISIANIYLVGYLANYGFKYNEKSYNRFVGKFKNTHKRDPNEAELEKAERNEIINFLRQKIQHCSTVCSRKARNITVGKDIRKYYAKTEASKDVQEDLILEDHKKVGYRKITHKEFKEALKKAESGIIKDENGFEVFAIERLNEGIDAFDYLQIIQSHDRLYAHNPESYLISLEEEIQDEQNVSRFNGLTQSEKISTLKKFIDRSKGDPSLKDEVASARKLLRKHSFWYGY